MAEGSGKRLAKGGGVEDATNEKTQDYDSKHMAWLCHSSFCVSRTPLCNNFLLRSSILFPDCTSQALRRRKKRLIAFFGKEKSNCRSLKIAVCAPAAARRRLAGRTAPEAARRRLAGRTAPGRTARRPVLVRTSLLQNK